ncbi:MAG: S1 RNA-binding domain-containing protein [Planctomycetaceae bacterium]|nr:S1 RNA-binding domain-containing protein [Planctomycetaceae bacterium]
MGDPVTINIRHLSRGLGIQLGQVQAALELLDEGNTVPFITRYRKDQTGGLDEEKIRLIQDRLDKMRLLSERKQTILRSIESQGKLTEELEKRIRSANTAKRLEDLYLPYKPKKQTLAQLARSRGLELLADEILNRSPGCSDLDRRAADFVNPDRGVPTAAEALLGAGHILAERISEDVELRQRLREIMQRSGRIASCRTGGEDKPAETAPAAKPPRPLATPAADSTTPAEESAESMFSAEPPESDQTPDAQAPMGLAQTPPPVSETESTRSGSSPGDAVQAPEPKVESEATAAADLSHAAEPPVSAESVPSKETPNPPEDDQPGSGMGGGPEGSPEKETEETSHEESRLPVDAAASVEPNPPAPHEAPVVASESETATPAETVTSEASPVPDTVVPEPSAPETSSAVSPDAKAAQPAVAPPPDARATAPSRPAPKRKGTRKSNAERKAERKRQKKHKAEEKRQKAFSDYFNYSEDLRKIPPHRVLAINRGERGKVLRVKIESDLEAMTKVVDELSVPTDHPHSDFLKGCARDALTRLILPGLERESRRELTERAESHAVGVFAKNLRNLLLQPPVHNRRVLAVDPGFKSGCKLVALDQFGNVLAQAVIYLIGKPERKEESQSTVRELMERFKLTVVAIGNGTACRDAEDFFGEILNEAPEGSDWAYVIVNEAGASVYSTSSAGREEFPEYDATVRGAISIGRRLQDPLSELVKIDPANIGVGLYQHDVKAKHLRESLDDVVSSCVNYVGVDVNTASPALLRYVSGLNQLTARRVYEHRMQNGPFRNREQLRNVTGFGDAAFVQSAGFLKIARGDNPLDGSWIHPESYDVARRVLERLGCQVDDLANRDRLKALSEKIAQVDASSLAKELGVGELLLKDILAQLVRPGRDPREDLPPPIFRRGVLKLEDLKPGLELSGTVLNVVDFGVFVDIGMHDSGLVHVSQLADKFVRDPHEVAAVGDIVKVWVLDVDKERRRVSLTMIPPGTPRTAFRREEGADRREERRPERAKPGQKPREQRGGQAKPREAARGRGHDDGHGRGHGHGRGPAPPFKPKSRPKPITPITKDMKEGREPMRSFSDLAQFFGTTTAEPEPPKKPKKKGDRPKTQKPQTPDSDPAASNEAVPPVVEPSQLPPEQAAGPSGILPPPDASAPPASDDPSGSAEPAGPQDREP